MDTLRKSTRPSTRAMGMRSFIRLKQRNTVVLPQPDGPIMAVISCSYTVKEAP